VKKYEQYKRLIRFLAGVSLIAIESIIFMYMWIYCYKDQMEMPYQRLGNYFLAVVYALILYIFSSIYGSLRLGYLRNGELIYTHTLATTCANAVSYIPIVLLVKHFRSPMPLVWLTVGQFVVIAGWGYVANSLYRKVYPPRNVIMVYGERPMKNLMEKIYSRADRFVIGASIRVDEENMKEVKELVLTYDGVVVCDLPSVIRNELLKFCYGHSLRVYTMPKISDIIIRGAENMHYFDTPLLLARNDGLSVEQAVLKRFMDIFVSLTMLIITSPILAVTALAIKFYDGGPVFFYQERCTKDGKVFSICKFRSMIVDAEKDGRVIPATEKDPRITPVGSFIRKVRIDELPQLWNILKGEMSLVGPRPERIEHVQLYSEKIPEFAYRMKVKGGLTGYAQVYGKYNTTAYDKLKLDLMYIQNYSLLLDIEILFKTVKILFEKESTEGFSEEASAMVEEISKSYESSDHN
jgi:exopolysaccharide biosynthesis polyprenyl glycosylphosphotransferase